MILKLGQVIGQQAAIRTLTAALPPGSPASAYLFTGPDGVGKMTTALAWAQSLFCLVRSGHDACGRCGACQKTGNGNNPDLIALAPAVREKKVKEEIDIESVRGLIERLGFKPYESARKVAIVSGADTMNLSAANAFLKTLEEPPGDTVMILTAANPGRLPATILSRCRTVRFAPIGRPQLETLLMETRGLDPASARAMASVCQGSIGAANPERIRENMELRASALDFIVNARSGPSAGAYKFARTMDRGKDREAVDRFLAMVYSLLREMAVIKFTAKYDNLMNVDIAGELSSAARDYSGGRILAVAGAAERLMAARSLNVNPFLTLSILHMELRKDS